MGTFFLREVWPRREQLFFDRHAIGSLLIASLSTFVLNRWGTELLEGIPKFGDLATALVAFAAITFGGCVAGATLAVALPSGRTLSVLSVNGDGEPKRRLHLEGKKLVVIDESTGLRVGAEAFTLRFRSNYKDLIFLFVYSAYVQLVLLAASLVALVAFGDSPLFGAGCLMFLSVAFASMQFLAFYSMTCLLACLKALFNLGEIRDSSIRGSAVEGTGSQFDP